MHASQQARKRLASGDRESLYWDCGAQKGTAVASCTPRGNGSSLHWEKGQTLEAGE